MGSGRLPVGIGAQRSRGGVRNRSTETIRASWPPPRTWQTSTSPLSIPCALMWSRQRRVADPGVARALAAFRVFAADHPGVIVEDKGVKILVDPKAVLFLLGTEMDYKADKMQAQFIFNNPNQVSACGCGESIRFAEGAAV